MRGRTGYHLSEETKRKISESEKGKIVSAEARKHISEAWKTRVRKRRLNISKDWLEFHYIVLKENPEMIANKAGCSRRSIYDWLDFCKIPKRTRAESMGKYKPSAETILKMSLAMRGRPGKPHSEETRRKLSESHKGKKQPPEQIAKKSGENAPNWRGGIAFKPYCHKFNDKLKAEVKEKFNFTCYLCREVKGANKLSVHHVDYNKNSICNGNKWPLIPLCRRCHGKTHYLRWYWFNLLINYWAMNQEININIFQYGPT